MGDRWIAVVGWNIPLVRATGLGAEGERDLGRMLAVQLNKTGWLRPGSRTRKSKRASPGPTLEPKGTTGDTAPERVSRGDLLRLLRTRRRSIRTFLEWADRREAGGESLRWDARRDIEEAREAAGWFEESW